ncbi:MAG: hypothetical protein U0R52_03330 [Solirubrobacterales bacterium]
MPLFRPAFGFSALGGSPLDPAFGFSALGGSPLDPAFGFSALGGSPLDPAFGFSAFGGSPLDPAFGFSALGAGEPCRFPESAPGSPRSRAESASRRLSRSAWRRLLRCSERLRKGFIALLSSSLARAVPGCGAEPSGAAGDGPYRWIAA